MSPSGTAISNVADIVRDLEDCLARMDRESDPRLAVAAAHVEQAITQCRLELEFAASGENQKAPPSATPTL
jgi:hypothetical protein